jgi:Ca-activated chloride channel family protein
MLGSEDARIPQITEIGLKYSLLTKYTSFFAIDDVVRNEGAEALKVKQPLPLPQGVSEYAVGEQAVPGTPEPATWMMLGISGLLLLWAFRKVTQEV